LEHLESGLQWLRQQPNVELLVIHHRDCIFQPAETAAQIERFLCGKLDVRKMSTVVRPELYRQKVEN
jgi:hypothetical protein